MEQVRPSCLSRADHGVGLVAAATYPCRHAMDELDGAAARDEQFFGFCRRSAWRPGAGMDGVFGANSPTNVILPIRR